MEWEKILICWENALINEGIHKHSVSPESSTWGNSQGIGIVGSTANKDSAHEWEKKKIRPTSTIHVFLIARLVSMFPRG